MRYRALDANGDMTFGLGGGNYLVNSQAAVAQAISTKLQLWAGEWFLDSTEGTPYLTDVLGNTAEATRNQAITDRILSVPGTVSITSISSSVEGRTWSVQATVNTVYGEITVNEGDGQ